MTPEEIAEARLKIRKGVFSDAWLEVTALNALDALEEARRDWQHAIEEASAQAYTRITRHEAEIALLESQLSEVREERDRMRSEGVRDDPALAALRKENDELKRCHESLNANLRKLGQTGIADTVELSLQLSASQAREEKLREALVRADKALQWCHDEHRSDGDQSLADLGDDIAPPSHLPSHPRRARTISCAECGDEGVIHSPPASDLDDVLCPSCAKPSEVGPKESQ